MNPKPLFEEYRNGILECVHHGMICVVDEKGITEHVGDTDFTCFYRSSSKALQALPVIAKRFDQKYGLTPKEEAIFSGSHWGDTEHVEILESILQKTGLREEQMIMLPTYPLRQTRREELLRANLPPRKIYHNCAGKHLGMMLLARELGESVERYWVLDSVTQKVIINAISKMTGVSERVIKTGVDGCGVPVYALPFHGIATSYLRLVNPSLIPDDVVAEAVSRNMVMLHENANMVAGKDIVDSIITADADMIAKSGALGVFAMGVKSLGTGIVVKVLDGSHDEFASCAIEINKQLGNYANAVKKVEEVYPQTIFNDNNEMVGYREAVFCLKDE